MLQGVGTKQLDPTTWNPIKVSTCRNIWRLEYSGMVSPWPQGDIGGAVSVQDFDTKTQKQPLFRRGQRQFKPFKLYNRSVFRRSLRADVCCSIRQAYMVHQPPLWDEMFPVAIKKVAMVSQSGSDTSFIPAGDMWGIKSALQTKADRRSMAIGMGWTVEITLFTRRHPGPLHLPILQILRRYYYPLRLESKSLFEPQFRS